MSGDGEFEEGDKETTATHGDAHTQTTRSSDADASATLTDRVANREELPSAGGPAVSSNVGPLVGGVLGGIVFLICIVALVMVVTRSRRNKDADATPGNHYGPAPSAPTMARRTTTDDKDEVYSSKPSLRRNDDESDDDHYGAVSMSIYSDNSTLILDGDDSEDHYGTVEVVSKSKKKSTTTTATGRGGGVDMIPLDDIVIGKKLGQGSFGVVFRGEWCGTKVAVKQIKMDPEAPNADKAREEFEKELELTPNLKVLLCVIVAVLRIH